MNTGLRKALELVVLDSVDSLKRLEAHYQDAKDVNFIFRGTTKKCDKEEEEKGVNSRLCRFGDDTAKFKEDGTAKFKEDGTAKFKEDGTAKFKLFNENYRPPDMEKDIVEKAKRLFPAKTTNRTILTSLQHFGGRTNLIDFSRNLYVALFFACDGDFEEDGELILVDTKKLKTLEEIDFDKLSELALVEPDVALMPAQRAFVQHSVFVYAKTGYIKRRNYAAISIPRNSKNKLLKYLKQMHNVHADSIYSDLVGFAENERNYKTAPAYFFRGREHFKKAEYDSAIENYNWAIDLKPGYVEAYNDRGAAYFYKTEYDLAIADFDKALDLKSDFAVAYYNRGSLFLIKKQWNDAKSDLTRTQEKGGDIIAAFKDEFGTMDAFEKKYELKVPDDIAEMLGGR